MAEPIVAPLLRGSFDHAGLAATRHAVARCAAGAGLAGRRLVDHAELHPHGPRADRERDDVVGLAGLDQAVRDCAGDRAKRDARRLGGAAGRSVSVLVHVNRPDAGVEEERERLGARDDCAPGGAVVERGQDLLHRGLTSQ